MISVLIGALAAYGVLLVYTAVAFGWSGPWPTPRRLATHRSDPAAHVRRWMRQAGLEDVRPVEFAVVSAILAVVGLAIGVAAFGPGAAAAVTGGAALVGPAVAARGRRARRLESAHDAWPQLIEEVRVLVGAAGRSIPHALLDVGRRGPAELRPAFVAAHRQWVLTTDFERTVTLLKAELADSTADAACETLLVAHEVGGSDVDRRLAELAEDRRIEQIGRKDARAEQAGARFARRFVVAVPAGMAAAGMSLGHGSAAYRTAAGQLAVTIGVGLVVVCWIWAGAMLRLPTTERVFR